MGYIAYGEDWKKEMMKFSKANIIEMFARKAADDAMKIEDLEASMKVILAGN